MNRKNLAALMLMLSLAWVAGCKTSGGILEGARYCFATDSTAWVAIDLLKGRDANLTEYGREMIIESSATWQQDSDRVVLTSDPDQNGIMWPSNFQADVLRVYIYRSNVGVRATLYLSNGKTSTVVGRTCECEDRTKWIQAMPKRTSRESTSRQ